MLLGEYVALTHGQAIMLPLPFFFEFSFEKNKRKKKEDFIFHRDSPAGKLFSEIKFKNNFEFNWVDPFKECGGFGGSTAEFLAVYKSFELLKNKKSSDPFPINKKYQKYFSHLNCPPSGMDLLCQRSGVFGLYNSQTKKIFPCHENILSRVLIFSATHQKNRKTQTHQHLEKLKTKNVLLKISRKLFPFIRRAYQAIQKNDGESLGQIFYQYSNILNQAGLEHEKTFFEREKLSQISGVFGIKGFGANLSDGLVLLTSKNIQKKELMKIKKTANNLDLKMVFDGNKK